MRDKQKTGENTGVSNAKTHFPKIAEDAQQGKDYLSLR